MATPFPTTSNEQSLASKIVSTILCIALLAGLFIGCNKVLKATLPIECKRCVNCGHTVRWQGGLPGQFGGPCRRCGGFMGDCE